MKKRRTLIIALLLIASLALGIGYAGFSVNMIVNGDAKMNATESKVVFSDAVLNEGATSTVEITVGGKNTNALSLKLSGFKAVGDTATVTVTVSNPHDFPVNVKLANFTSDDKTNAEGVEYLEVTHTFPASQTIDSEGTYTFEFTVTCKATTPDAVTENFELRLLAEAGSQGAATGQ